MCWVPLTQHTHTHTQDTALQVCDKRPSAVCFPAHTFAHRLLQLVGPIWGYGKRKQRDNKLINRSEFVQFDVLNYIE